MSNLSISSHVNSIKSYKWAQKPAEINCKIKVLNMKAETIPEFKY